MIMASHHDLHWLYWKFRAEAVDVMHSWSAGEPCGFARNAHGQLCLCLQTYKERRKNKQRKCGLVLRKSVHKWGLTSWLMFHLLIVRTAPSSGGGGGFSWSAEMEQQQQGRTGGNGGGGGGWWVRYCMYGSEQCRVTVDLFCTPVWSRLLCSVMIE